jgi:hypothetical protein
MDKEIKTQIENIVDFVIKNKDVVPIREQNELVIFLERQLVKLNMYGIRNE